MPVTSDKVDKAMHYPISPLPSMIYGEEIEK